jgi:hypothetical protein
VDSVALFRGEVEQFTAPDVDLLTDDHYESTTIGATVRVDALISVAGAVPATAAPLVWLQYKGEFVNQRYEAAAAPHGTVICDGSVVVTVKA